MRDRGAYPVPEAAGSPGGQLSTSDAVPSSPSARTTISDPRWNVGAAPHGSRITGQGSHETPPATKRAG